MGILLVRHGDEGRDILKLPDGEEECADRLAKSKRSGVDGLPDCDQAAIEGLPDGEEAGNRRVADGGGSISSVCACLDAYTNTCAQADAN